MNISAEFKSNLHSLEEREVYRINDDESLIEKEGYYLIKNVDKKTTGVYYRGIDRRYDLPQVLDLVKRGA